MNPGFPKLVAALVMVVILISVLAAPTLARTTLAEAQAAAADPIGAALHAAATMTMSPSSGGMGESSAMPPPSTVPPAGAVGAIPGTIQAEDYATGGQGFGWYDRTPGNEGGAYREDDVDIETGASGYAVAYVKSSEWLNYAVDVAETGTYTATFRAASPWDNREVWVWVDGVLKAQAKVPNTGSFDTYENTTATFALPAGKHALRLEFYRDAQNLDLVTFALAASPTPTPGGNVTPTPTSNGTAPDLLDPKTIPQWENQLNGPPPVYEPVSKSGYDYYEVNASEFTEQILPPGMPKTTVWGYGGLAKDAVTGQSLGFIRNSPAPSFRITRHTTTRVKWINDLTNPHLFAVDPTIMWADPNNLNMGGMPSMLPTPWPSFPPGFADAQTNVPMIPHVHGAEVQSTSDGHPNAWFTAKGTHGPDYHTVTPTDANAAIFEYPNTQQAGTIWYHDHAMGMTRINVMSGLAGYYFIRDANDPIETLLPQGQYEMPLAIQDRIFYANGSLYFPSDGINPEIHPYWNPEFFGDTIMVNGKVWPNMNVNQGTYRFHLLDGSNARFYNLSFSNGMGFTQIGTDGGYLRTAAPLTELMIAPGERADILVDFSKLPVGTKVVLQNSAPAPFPTGDNVDPQTTGQIVQFTVTGTGGPAFPVLPAVLNPTLAGADFPTLPDSSVVRTRVLTLQEIMGPNGPQQILLDGQPFEAPVSEKPKAGTTEDWVIVDTTADTHPIHLHLVQFQLVSRQAFQTSDYQSAWLAAQGVTNEMLMGPLMNPTVPVDPTPYLEGEPSGPLSSELGWKDTIQMNPGEVTRIRVRFTAQDGSPFVFDPTVGPGYVWHCHIIDHEDNDMMRPYTVTA